MNAGQICTCVDYMLLPRARVAEFVALVPEIVPRRYRDISSPDYTSIIDARAFDRLTHALEDARTRGARVVQLLPGNPWDEASRKIAPHLVIDPPPGSELMQREIFGPLLPIVRLSC